MLVKRIIYLFMIFLVISHGVFQIFIFKIFKAKYRAEMVEIIERGVSDEELVLFCFDVEDFDKGLIEIEWKEKNEFRSNGEMYDVVKKEIKGDSVYLHCVPDKKESFLYTVLENQSKSSHDKAKSLNIFKNLLSQFYFKPVENRNDSADNGTSEFLTYISSNPLKAEHLPETPPPRV